MIKGPGIWLAVFSATTVFYLVGSDLGRTSPGPLATVHERIPELSGRGGCAQCHGGWMETMGEACLDCHAAVADQLAAGSGLHADLSAEQVQNCAVCHSDHHGSDFAVVNTQSFAMAGVPDIAAFDHSRLGFDMQGKHLELDCAECHTNAGVDVLAEGTYRFMGLDASCAACHEDSHDGEYQLTCIRCHGQDSFTELHSSGHDEQLPLTGTHADVACSECHADDGAHSLAFLASGRRRADPRACLDCHDSPHEGGFMEGVARTEGASLEASCATCHDPDLHLTFGDEAVTLSPKQHALTGFRLVEPHSELRCEECHAGGEESGEAEFATRFAARFPGRRADDCGACHVDPHEGQFEGGLFGDGCLTCHDRQHFEPHYFDLADHAQTSMPLVGSHAELECQACHAAPHEDAPRAFSGTSNECAACHLDAHLGFFAGRELEEAHAPSRDANATTTGGTRSGNTLVGAHASGTDCATCHVPSTFQELAQEPFDHAFWTGFLVEGAHAQTGCEACHPRSATADRSGRTFGRVEDHFGTYVGCETCHDDPHRGVFDAPHLPELVDGRASCARCHDASSFRSFEKGFFHNMWTGFPLLGKHGDIDCSACHTSSAGVAANNLAWAQPSGTECYDCHVDPHAGQFRRKGLTDCSSCHTNAKGWDRLSFDHDKHSRFPLEEQHESLDCSACHEGWPLEDGTEIIRYRPLGMQCIDCHGVHEDQMRERADRQQ